MKSANNPPIQATTSDTRLKSPWRLPARLLWLILSAVAVYLFIAGIPLRANDIHEQYRGDVQVALKKNLQGEIYVFTIWGDSPLPRAGVMEGDILLSIDQTLVTSVEQAEALLIGPVGTPVTLQIRTGNFPPRQVTATRAGELAEILHRFGLSSQLAVPTFWISEILFGLVCVTVALVIFWFRSDDWMALFSSLVLTMVLVGINRTVIAFILRQSNIYLWWWLALTTFAMMVFFYVFPTGQFIPPITRLLTFGLAIWIVVNELNYQNLIELPWNLSDTDYILIYAAWLLTGVAAIIYRYLKKSDPMQRQQIRWVFWGMIACGIGIFLQIFPDLNFPGPEYQVFYDFVLLPLGRLLELLLPLAIGFAILRYRLWDIKIILNRSLVYTALTLAILALYGLSVGGLSTLFRTANNQVIFIVATGLVAVAVQPLHRQLQQLVNRLMYGERDDPYAVLTRLANNLERTPSTDQVLPAIASAVGQALKTPFVSLQVDDGRAAIQAAVYGQPVEDCLSFPLIYHNETIGRLDVARRRAGEEFSKADYRLIENISHQAGPAAQAVRLNADLVRSRAQIVIAREEERRRLRRDLHDGLGPILASQTLKMAAVRQLIKQNPQKAEILVDDVIQQNENTVTEVRRLVYGLRPPSLDTLGLVGAISDLALRADQDYGKSGMQIVIAGPPEGLPPLPAAVEVNAYRIALEALTNAARHAQAELFTIQFSCENDCSDPTALVIRMIDDGVGIPIDYRLGVGLRSMNERAEELGGILTIERLEPHGTQITCRLPITTSRD